MHEFMSFHSFCLTFESDASGALGAAIEISARARLLKKENLHLNENMPATSPQSKVQCRFYLHIIIQSP